MSEIMYPVAALVIVCIIALGFLSWWNLGGREAIRDWRDARKIERRRASADASVQRIRQTLAEQKSKLRETK